MQTVPCEINLTMGVCGGCLKEDSSERLPRCSLISTLRCAVQSMVASFTQEMDHIAHSF